MVSKLLRNGLLASAVFTSALFSAAPVMAKSYSLSLDPAFGAIFGSLSWQADGRIDVADACLAQSDNNYTPANPACAGTTFTSMQVTFYETGDLGGSATQVFNALIGPVTISRLGILGGELKQIDAGFFGDFGPTCPGGPSCGIALGGIYNFSLVLAGSDVEDSASVNFGRIFYGKKPMTGQAAAVCAAINPDRTLCGVSEFNARVTITPIPEPATYALALAGIAALGLTARRRRAA